MIKLNIKIKNTLKTVIICLFSGAFFVLCGYFYLQTSTTETDNLVSDIPYSSSNVQNAGILLDICDSKTFIYLDFEGNDLLVIFPDESVDDMQNNLYGYSVNYKIKGDYLLVADIVDLLDGIEMTQNEETLRFTGIQISDMLARSEKNSELKKQVISEIFKKIGERGFEKSGFVYIIENSQTNLTVPDCYFWSDYISGVCKNARFIN